MRLYIGNKNLSSWSMRAWLVCTAFDLPFEEALVAFSAPGSADDRFAQTMQNIHPNGKVPALAHDDLVLWDSLAICEYLAECFPEKALWPADRMLRARARCISAEMHSSFMPLRSACPMNIAADLALKGRRYGHPMRACVRMCGGLSKFGRSARIRQVFCAGNSRLPMPFMRRWSAA